MCDVASPIVSRSSRCKDAARIPLGELITTRRTRTEANIS